MTTAVLGPFAAAAERDFAFFNVAQIARSQLRWSFRLLMLVFVAVPFFVCAQVVPFVYRRHLALLVPQLPHIQSEVDFAFVKDALTLYYFSLREYARYCLFKRQALDLLDEIEEQLDSIEFVSANKQFLDSAVAQIHRR